MSYPKVKEYLSSLGVDDHISIHSREADTVTHAAEIIGCSEGEIAKSLTFEVDGEAVMVVAAGDAKVNNGKFKSFFHCKSTMLPREKVEEMIGHKPGAVCPFGVNEGVRVYMDVSLKRFDTVHAAGGEANVTVAMSVEELWKYSRAIDWVDVCKGWETDSLGEEKV